MFHTKRIVFYLATLLVLITACEKEFEGDRNATLLPETFALVDTVKRDPANFLTTTVTAQWWGQSQNGFIVGYEVSTDNMQTWKYTTDQSGTFTLELPFGTRSGLLPIYIRAIDNRGQKDPTPAQMVFPVQNTAPRIAIDPVANKRPFRTFPVIRSIWNVIDIDGVNDIGQYELVLNDTTLNRFVLPANFAVERVDDSTSTVAVRIEAVIQNGTFTNNCQVYTGNRTTPIAGYLQGIVYNDTNRLYIREIDKTGNTSAWQTDVFFVRLPSSDILMVNALTASSNSIQSFYTTQLSSAQVGITNFDVIFGIATATRSDEFYTDALTQSRTFSLFRKIIWLTDEPNTLTTLQQNTVDFFNKNGKAFIYVDFPDNFPSNSTILNFTPIEQLITDTLGRNFRMNVNGTAFGNKAGWPVLRSTAILKARPFKTYGFNTGLYGYDTLMQGEITLQGAGIWPGVSTIMSKRIKNSTSKTDMVITSLPLQGMNANANADSLFKIIFKDELEF